MAAKKAKKPAKKAAKKAAAPKRAAKRAPAKKEKAKASAMPVPIVHWEIQAKDAKKVQRFYGDLFGWRIDASNPMNYGMVESRGKEGINGGIGGTMHGLSKVVVYAAVPDINATLSKAESLGAKTLLPRTDIGAVVMALFEDPEGNTFGVVEG
jgi:predicted enzyme related to lactoylglutathione lyase